MRLCGPVSFLARHYHFILLNVDTYKIKLQYIMFAIKKILRTVDGFIKREVTHPRGRYII